VPNAILTTWSRIAWARWKWAIFAQATAARRT
jgi:hypothetical protein